jgi:hypothetical protein
MPKKQPKTISPMPVTTDENYHFPQIATIIEKKINMADARVNNETVMMFWGIGHFINTPIIGDNRAEYGKRIFPTLPGKFATQQDQLNV